MPCAEIKRNNIVIKYSLWERDGASTRNFSAEKYPCWTDDNIVSLAISY